MAITIKAFLELEKSGNAVEIRRFAGDAKLLSDFYKLRVKVIELFPSLTDQDGKVKEFRMYWKDVDNDSVAFSSTEELQEAVRCATDGLLRIYIQVRPGSASQGGSSAGAEGTSPRGGGEEHPNVVCDACDQKVYGIRYKCMQCPDYDLCEQCEAVTAHNAEHTMIKIRHPGPHPWQGFLPPFVRRMMKQAWRNGGGAWGPHHVPPFAGGPHGGFGRGCHGGAWSRAWTTGNNDQAEAKAESGSSGGAQADPPKNEEGTEEDVLKNIGESVAAMLDPLGIDVLIDVETNGQRKRCGGQRKWKNGCGNRKGSPAKKEAAAGDEKQKKEKEDTGATAENAEKVDDAPKQEQEAGTTETGARSKSPEAKSATDHENGEWTYVHKEEVPEVEVVDEDHKVKPDAAPGNQSGGSLYPTLEQDEEVASSPLDPRIAHALEQMSAMGFSNEGGWLVRLLEAKDGDISRVLDAIQPNKKN